MVTCLVKPRGWSAVSVSLAHAAAERGAGAERGAALAPFHRERLFWLVRRRELRPADDRAEAYSPRPGVPSGLG
jgi:hypothetical protein